MIYTFLADLLVVIHLAFIVFVVIGGLLVFRWKRIVFLHVPAVIWAVLIEFKGWICPLTPWEQQLRRVAGETAYTDGFIEHYIIPVIYPQNLSDNYQLLLGFSVLIINLGIYSLFFYRNFVQK